MRNFNRIVSAAIDPVTHATLLERSNQTGKSVSEIIREAITAYLTEREPDTPLLQLQKHVEHRRSIAETIQRAVETWRTTSDPVVLALLVTTAKECGVTLPEDVRAAAGIE